MKGITSFSIIFHVCFTVIEAHPTDKSTATSWKSDHDSISESKSVQNARMMRVMKANKMRSHIAPPSNLYPPDDIISPNDDYFVSYDTDYVNPPNNFSAMVYDNTGDTSAIFPDPEMIVYENSKTGRGASQSVSTPQVDVLPDVELPGNWLSDNDLREHDMIDSVEYVYYGSRRNRSSNLRWLAPILAGVAISTVTILATCLVLFYKHSFRSSKMFPIEMNLLSCLLTTNVIYLVGIQDTKSDLRCEVIALLLHYMHLVSASWIFVFCYVISDNVTKGCIPNLRYNYLFAYGVPAVFVLFYYALSLENYEIKNYCWMSLEKGMLLGFMLPGTILILLNTLFAMCGLKTISRKQQEAISNTLQSYLSKGITSESRETLKTRKLFVKAEACVNGNSLNNADALFVKNTCSKGIKDTDLSNEDEQSMKNVDLDCLHGESSSWVSTNFQVNSTENLDMKSEDFYDSNIKIDLSSLSLDNLSWKTAEPEGISDMRKCLNFALLMQPLFCVLWFMGVVALENSDQILPPMIFAFLWTHMHIFVLVRFSYVLPYIPYEEWCTESYEAGHPLAESNIAMHCTTSTDTVPLLVNKTDTVHIIHPCPPNDSISTITS